MNTTPSMCLFSAPYSPFAKMVRVTAQELGREGEIEIVDGDTWLVPDVVMETNPLGKVPTLVVDSDIVIYDSRVICEYLCNTSCGQTLLPVAQSDRGRVLTLQSLGVGLMDTMVERFLERWRPQDKQMPDWADRLRQRAFRCYDFLERACDGFESRVDAGTIAISSALSYVSFRFPEDEWQVARPRLARWHESFEHRPSMVATRLRDLERD